MNKRICFLYTALLAPLALLILSPNPGEAQEQPPLLKITKEVVTIGNMIDGGISIERTGRCQINSDGLLRYQLFQGSYDPRLDQRKKLSSSDLSLLMKILKALKDHDQPQNYVFEYDFTGDQIQPNGPKEVKNDEAVAFVDSKEIRFYWMKRRLLRTYNGPQASVLRELLKKYCLMSI